MSEAALAYAEKASAPTFVSQSEVFLQSLAQRKRNPVSAATLATWRSIIRTHIVPRIGTHELESFENLQLKHFADDLHADGISPKLTHYAVQIVKRIIRDTRDSNGMRLYAREWDSEFLDLPTIPKSSTYMPTPEELAQAIKMSESNETLRALIMFCSGTGARIGESLACRIGPERGEHTTWDPTTSTVYVRSSMFRNKEQDPKTDAAVRDVDIPKILNDFLIEFAGTRTGILFPNRVGKTIHDSSAHAQLNRVGIRGFHGLRRWRVTQIRKCSTPVDLENFWIGHADSSLGALYSKVREDNEFRRQWTERIGLGFQLP